MRQLRRRTFTLIELLVVIFFLALLISFLLPALSRARRSAMDAKMRSDEPVIVQSVSAPPDPTEPVPPETESPLAQLTVFDATIELTPRLSVGTAEPESIYSARMEANLIAQSPAGNQGECEIQLPLPPHVISVGDLSVMVNGVESAEVRREHEQLIWHGKLPSTPTPIQVKYTSLGQGLFALRTPQEQIIDRFKIALTANESDVRMLQLSLQPTSFDHAARRTTYVWDYKRLMFGHPIALDVLGIAPIDRLGELSWLGPISVVAFGIVIGLMSRAYTLGNFDRWMLLLVLGTFTGAYPLMYFAQQFIPLNFAMAISASAVIAIITWRMISIMGWRLGIAGVTLPAAVIMTITLAAAVHPALQGILLTVLTLGLFMLAMTLAPRFRVGVGAIPSPA